MLAIALLAVISGLGTRASLVRADSSSVNPPPAVAEIVKPSYSPSSNDIYPLPKEFESVLEDESSPDGEFTVRPIVVKLKREGVPFEDKRDLQEDVENVLNSVNAWIGDQFNQAGRLTIREVKGLEIPEGVWRGWQNVSPQEFWEQFLRYIALDHPEIIERNSLHAFFVERSFSPSTYNPLSETLPLVTGANPRGVLMITQPSELRERMGEKKMEILVAHLLLHALGIPDSGKPGVVFEYPEGGPPPIIDPRAFTVGVDNIDWRLEITQPDIAETVGDLKEIHIPPLPTSPNSERSPSVEVLASGFITPERAVDNCTPLSADEFPAVVVVRPGEVRRICSTRMEGDLTGKEPLVVVKGRGGVVDFGGSVFRELDRNNGGVVLWISGGDITVRNAVVLGGWLGVYGEGSGVKLERMLVAEQRMMRDLIRRGDYGDPNGWLYFHLTPQDMLTPANPTQLGWQNYGVGVVFDNVEGGRIENSFIGGQDVGVLANGGKVEILNNLILGNYWGVRIWEAKKVNVIKNTIMGNFEVERWWRYWGDAAGISFPWNSRLVRIIGNRIYLSADAIFSASIQGVPYLGGGEVEIRGNEIYLTTAHGVEFTLNRVSTPQGSVTRVGRLVVENNTIGWPFMSGGWFGGCFGCVFRKNTVKGANALRSPFSPDAPVNPFGNWPNQAGVSARNASGVLLFGNIFLDGPQGIVLPGGRWNSILDLFGGRGGHIVYGNEFSGLSIGLRTEVQVVAGEDNTFTDVSQRYVIQPPAGGVKEGLLTGKELAPMARVVLLSPGGVGVVPVFDISGEKVPADDFQVEVEGDGFTLVKKNGEVRISSEGSDEVQVAKVRIVPSPSREVVMSSADGETLPREILVYRFPFINSKLIVSRDGKEMTTELSKHKIPYFDFGMDKEPFSVHWEAEFIVPEELPPFALIFQTDGVMEIRIDGEIVIKKDKPSGWLDVGYSVVRLPPGRHTIEVVYRHTNTETSAQFKIFPLPVEEMGIAAQDRDEVEKGFQILKKQLISLSPPGTPRRMP